MSHGYWHDTCGSVRNWQLTVQGALRMVNKCEQQDPVHILQEDEYSYLALENLMLPRGYLPWPSSVISYHTKTSIAFHRSLGLLLIQSPIKQKYLAAGWEVRDRGLVHKADISGADAFNENEFDEIEHHNYCDRSQLWRYVFGIISQLSTSQSALVPPLSWV